MPDESRESEQSLLWYGRRNFGGGEPTVILIPASSEVGLDSFWLAIIGIAVMVVGGFLVYWFLLKPKQRKKMGVRSLGKNKFEIKSDEEKVMDYLNKSGGRIYQSMITKSLDFPKLRQAFCCKEWRKKDW